MEQASQNRIVARKEFTTVQCAGPRIWIYPSTFVWLFKIVNDQHLFGYNNNSDPNDISEDYYSAFIFAENTDNEFNLQIDKWQGYLSVVR